MACGKTAVQATAIQYRYFSTNRLRSFNLCRSSLVKVVYLVRIVCRYARCALYKLILDQTSLKRHHDAAYPFQHTFMSQVLCTATGLHLLVGSQACSRWLRTIMDHIGADPKYKGGSMCMAAAIPKNACNQGVPTPSPSAYRTSNGATTRPTRDWAILYT